MTDPLALLVAFVIGTLAVARATRLIVADAYPPAQTVRLWWVNHTGQKWGPLLTCPFCAAPYLAALGLAWVVLAGVWSPDLHTWAGWWWLGGVWAAVSYLAAMIVVRDEPPEEG